MYAEYNFTVLYNARSSDKESTVNLHLSTECFELQPNVICLPTL